MVARKSQARTSFSGDMRGLRKLFLMTYGAKSSVSEGTEKFPIVLETDRKLFLMTYGAKSEFPIRAPLGLIILLRVEDASETPKVA